MNEFSSDKEFYSNYLLVRDSLLKQGWIEAHPKRDDRVISSLFIKDGYGMHILYGCEEEIRDEIL